MRREPSSDASPKPLASATPSSSQVAQCGRENHLIVTAGLKDIRIKPACR